MGSARPDDWMDRLSRSLRDHENERRRKGSAMPRYEILDELGRGGMGVVHRAWDPQLGREVALKLLLDRADASADARERFLREAQLASRLSHPNIVAVHDTGEWMGQAYLAMQLIDGTTIEKADLDLRAKLGAIRDAARALDYAHHEGIVHRDVKPANLMVDRHGRVYVMDFGLARRTDISSRMTITGVLMGTPSFMSPEQALGKPVDARSDVYALGATMYDLMAGRPPFTGTDALKVMKQVAEDEPPPPRQHRPELPSAVEKIILKAMEKDPAHRYSTAGDLADDIQRYLNGETIKARPAPLRFRASRFLARNRAATLVAAVVVLGALAWIVLDRMEETNRLKKNLDLIVSQVRGDDWAGADQVMTEMTERAPDHRITRTAEEFLGKAKKAYQKAVALKDSASAMLDGREVNLASAWKEIKELALVKLPPAPGENSEPDWYPGIARFKKPLENLLVGQLKRRITEDDALQPEALRPLLTLAEEVEPGLAGRLIPRLSARVQRWARVRGAEAKPMDLRNTLRELDSGGADALTRDVTTRLQDRLKKDRESLPKTERIEMTWNDAEQAFQNDSPMLLQVAREMLFNAAEGTKEGAQLDGAPAWLVDVQRAERELDLDLEKAERLAKGLDPATLPERLRERAGKRLASLRKQLAARKNPIYAKKVAEDVRSAYTAGNFDTATSQLKHLLTLPGRSSIEKKDLVDLLNRVTDLKSRETIHRNRIEQVRDSLGEAGLDEAKDRLAILKTVAVTSARITAIFREVEEKISFLERASALKGLGRQGDEAGFKTLYDVLEGEAKTDWRATLVDPILELARVLVERGRGDRARVWLNRGAALDPGSWSLLEKRGIIHRDQKERDKATADWRNAARILGTSPLLKTDANLRLARARLLRRLGDYDAALKEANAALDIQRDVSGYLMRGQIRYVHSQVGPGREALIEEALNDFRAAKIREPGNPFVFYWLGTAEHPRRSTAGTPGARKALEALKKSVDLGYPGDDAVLQMARLLVDHENLWNQRRAEELLTPVLDGKKIALQGDEYVAALYEDEGRPRPEANREFKRDCLSVRARARYFLKDYNGCVADCSEALKLAPKHYSSHLYLGMASCKLLAFEQAHKALKAAKLHARNGKEREYAEIWRKKICDESK